MLHDECMYCMYLHTRVHSEWICYSLVTLGPYCGSVYDHCEGCLLLCTVYTTQGRLKYGPLCVFKDEWTVHFVKKDSSVHTLNIYTSSIEHLFIFHNVLDSSDLVCTVPTVHWHIKQSLGPIYASVKATKGTPLSYYVSMTTPHSLGKVIKWSSLRHIIPVFVHLLQHIHVIDFL